MVRRFEGTYTTKKSTWKPKALGNVLRGCKAHVELLDECLCLDACLCISHAMEKPLIPWFAVTCQSKASFALVFFCA